MFHTALATAAKVLARHGQPERAARLVGVVEGVSEDTGIRLQRSAVPEFETGVALVLQQLGDQAFDVLRAEGRAMKLEDAVEHALEDSTA